MNPIRLIKNLINEFLLKVSGTWVGAPKDEPWPETPHWMED